MLTEDEQKKVVKMYRIDKIPRVDIAKVMGVHINIIKPAIIDFERTNQLKVKRQAELGEVVDFHRNGGTASGEVIKVSENSVIVKLIDMEEEPEGLEGRTVVNHKRYRVVDQMKVEKAVKGV